MVHLPATVPYQLFSSWPIYVYPLLARSGHLFAMLSEGFFCTSIARCKVTLKVKTMLV